MKRLSNITESIWSDIQDRSSGETIRKEDDVNNLDDEGLKDYIDQGIIEAVNLGFIRGCSWDRTILYVSEGQNITGGGYKLLISRCGQGSQLWVNGDILQTDNKEFEKNNGLLRLSNSLKNNPLAGTIKLIKTERSAVANLAKII